MNNKLDKLNELYKNLEVSDKLDSVLSEAINKKRHNKSIIKLNTNKVVRRTVAIASCLVISFIVGINTSTTFANTLYNIPVVGEIARFVTFKDYSFENETSKGEIHIPEFEYEANEEIENKINSIIQERIDEVVKEQAILDEEYKKAYLETGGTEADYRKIETEVDYKIGYIDENIVSFEIYKYQTLAPAYNENYYYTFNLKTGEQLNLKDLLGEDFVAIVKEKVLKEMEARMKENPDNVYDTTFEFAPIDENRSFYIDSEGNIVVTFAKYEVASGYMGKQEFVIKKLID